MKVEKSDNAAARSAHWVLDLLAFVSLAVSLGVLVLYLCHYSRPDFSSDDATNNLIAQAMFDEGTLYPRTWMVTNGELMFPSAAMLIAPLLYWLPNGFTVHAIACVLLAGAMLAGIGWFMRVAKLPSFAVALVLMVLALGFSREFLVMVYVETAYVWWPMAFFVMAALIVLHEHETREAHGSGWALLALLFGAAFLISLKSPLRVAFMVMPPALVFSRVLTFYDAKFARAGMSVDGRKFGAVSAREVTILLAAACAYIAFKTMLYAEVVVDHAAASNLGLTDFSGFKTHLKLFLTGWFEFFGAHVEIQTDPSLEPFFRAFRSLIVVALTLVAALELRDFKINREPIRRALVLSFFASFVPILMVYLLFDPLARDYVTTRYFILPYVFLVVLAGWRVRDALRRASSLKLVAVSSFCVLALLSGVHRMIPLHEAQANRTSRPIVLAEALQREGLRHGFGSWWNAGATTIMSDSKVRVDPVLMSSSMITPHGYLIDTRWFTQKSETDTSFLILADDELKPSQRIFLDSRFGSPSREIEAGDARILVYNRDISASFNCTDVNLAMNASLEDDAYAKVDIISAEWEAPSGPGDLPGLKVRVRNNTDKALASTGLYPIAIGIHLLDRRGEMVQYDFVHQSVGCALRPQEERDIDVAIPQVSAGEYRLEVDMVQEGQAWFGLKGGKTRFVDLVVP